MRTVIFDLDGTLADTSGDLIAAANTVFRARGLGDLLDPAVDAATAFRGGKAMLRLGYNRAGLENVEAAVEADYAPAIEAYAASIDRHTTLYPGALEAVSELKSLNYRVGICTNKPVELAETLLDRLGVIDRFASLVGAGTLAVRKPDPAPYRLAVEDAGGALEHSLLVGDTVTDRDTARAAGVPIILVTFGADADQVGDLAPDATLPDYAALVDRVRELIG
ncbi:MAG: HAD-IA family hydrolase [Pseudomonadota bacterium]